MQDVVVTSAPSARYVTGSSQRPAAQATLISYTPYMNNFNAMQHYVKRVRIQSSPFRLSLISLTDYTLLKPIYSSLLYRRLRLAYNSKNVRYNSNTSLVYDHRSRLRPKGRGRPLHSGLLGNSELSLLLREIKFIRFLKLFRLKNQ